MIKQEHNLEDIQKEFHKKIDEFIELDCSDNFDYQDFIDWLKVRSAEIIKDWEDQEVKNE